MLDDLPSLLRNTPIIDDLVRTYGVVARPEEDGQSVFVDNPKGVQHTASRVVRSSVSAVILEDRETQFDVVGHILVEERSRDFTKNVENPIWRFDFYLRGLMRFYVVVPIKLPDLRLEGVEHSRFWVRIELLHMCAFDLEHIYRVGACLLGFFLAVEVPDIWVDALVAVDFENVERQMLFRSNAAEFRHAVDWMNGDVIVALIELLLEYLNHVFFRGFALTIDNVGRLAMVVVVDCDPRRFSGFGDTGIHKVGCDRA